MAHLLGADGIALTIGTRTLLADVSLGLDDGDRVGVVGPNGAGKSTLLRILTGTAQPDAGRVTRVGGSTWGMLDQRDEPNPDATILDLVHGATEEHLWASDPRIRKVHDGLLADLDWNARVAKLSGGQRRRVALAALLVQDPDVLMLDEPTNHLDVEGVAWLAAHLQERYGTSGRSAGRRGASGALVVVTHDRWFLDEVCSRMWEVRGDGSGSVDGYDGGYAAYILARAERARQAAFTSEKRNNLLRKELAWLRRGAPARTSKPKFRLDAASALINNEPPPRDSMELTRMATRRLGKDVLDLESVSLELGGKVLFDNVTWRLGPGDRYGVVGVNGAGKTTLLALLAGRRSPDAGRVKQGRTIHVKELSQDVAELDELGHLKAVEVIEQEKSRVVVDGKELTASQLTEKLGFTRERAHTPVRDLSGGERRRLQLLRLLVAEPNVLLLDEPTNDLDTDTLAAVEDLLDGWLGTLIVVSHDRYLLERVADRQIALFGDGTIRDLPGGVEEYLRLRATTKSARALNASNNSGKAARELQANTVPTQGNNAPSEVLSQREIRAAQKEAARIERRLAKLAEKEAELHETIAQQATDYQAVARLDAELRDMASEREELEMAWLEAAETAS